MIRCLYIFFFFSSRRRHTRSLRDWSSDVCSSDLLTLGLIQSKLAEHRITPQTIEVGDGAQQTLGPFDCEFLAVNHSIPDALAVAIRTRAGVVLHTGDFKMDQLPLDGRL